MKLSSETMNNAQAWEKLFSKHDIQRNIDMYGQFRISAGQIKEFREPRLMTKFDHKINLPDLFSKNDLAILPVTRGDYVIAHFDAYHVLEQSTRLITRMIPPDNIQSLDYNNIPSEAIALNCALAAGIISDFLGEEQLIATVSGRMGTGAFDFSILDTKSKTLRPVSVSNAQMEIDAAYEGHSCMALFEAKLAKSGIFEDFMTRQLYYPFRVWQSRITKPVRPVFLVYSNEIFRLYEYEFERVVNLCELLNDNDMNTSDVTEEYTFTTRQTRYYTDSTRYLGLVEKKRDSGETVYALTPQGRRIMGMSYRKRQLSFCELILSHKAFRETLALSFSTGHMPSNQDITDIMRHSGLHGVGSEETFRRRASTIRGWVNWITSLLTD